MPPRTRAVRWTGPPPLLIVASIVACLLGFSLSDSAAEESRPDERTATTSSARHDQRPVRRGGERSATAPHTERPASTNAGTIGVVSFNEWAKLPDRQIAADARAITSLPTVDIVGWQEAYKSRPIFAALERRGWSTAQVRGDGRELAISWRSAEFELESSNARLVAWGVGNDQGRYPFPNRYVQRVTLRHVDTGQLISVINTHLPQKIEDLDHPGHWLETSNAARARYQLARMAREWSSAPGRWVVGTGDFNFDARSDARLRPTGGLRSALGPVVVSSYAVLGTDAARPSHPPTGRFIDYVLAGRRDVRLERTTFVGQRVVDGLHSDHNALLARIRLR